MVPQQPLAIYSRRSAVWLCGFTLPEVLVVVAIAVIVTTLFLAGTNRSTAKARMMTCQVNLRQIYVGFRLFTIHSNRRLPDTAGTNRSWEQAVEPYLEQSRVVFACPADSELFPATGSSYDWRDTGDPLTTLAGASLADVDRPSAVFSFDSLPGWHLPEQMNAVRVDGSVQSLHQCDCLADLLVAIRRRK